MPVWLCPYNHVSFLTCITHCGSGIIIEMLIIHFKTVALLESLILKSMMKWLYLEYYSFKSCENVDMNVNGDNENMNMYDRKVGDYTRVLCVWVCVFLHNAECVRVSARACVYLFHWLLYHHVIIPKPFCSYSGQACSPSSLSFYLSLLLCVSLEKESKCKRFKQAIHTTKNEILLVSM